MPTPTIPRMPYTASQKDDIESARAQQLRSLSLQTESAATGDQLYTALGPPSCPFSPGAVDDKRSQWDIASDASSLPSHQHVSVGLQSPPPSEQSCYSRRLTEYSFDASGPGPPTQQHTPYTGLGVPSNQSPWLDPQPDSRVIQQQPLSPQLGPPTQPQDKLTSSLCTATTVLRSQTGCTLGQSSRATC
jgi:hypothetical protein